MSCPVCNWPSDCPPRYEREEWPPCSDPKQKADLKGRGCALQDDRVPAGKSPLVDAFRKAVEKE